ncbi:hypothetical protein GCM10028819_36880 [Spirosoma humi]
MTIPTNDFIGIIILNYNNPIATKNCIESVTKYSSDSKIKLLIVDNFSTQNSKNELLKILFNIDKDFVNINNFRKGKEMILGKINFIQTPANNGYAYGNNYGLSIVYNDPEIKYIMILNNDILFTQNIFPTLLNFIDLKTDAAVVSPLLYDKNGKIDYDCARKRITPKILFAKLTILGKLHYFKKSMLELKILLKNPTWVRKDFFKIDLPSGSCMLSHKINFYKIGGFDPKTFLYYEEDILSYKIQKAGLSSYLIPTVSCIHLGGNTIQLEKNSFIKKCYDNSALYFSKKYLKIPMIYYLILYMYVKIRIIKNVFAG